MLVLLTYNTAIVVEYSNEVKYAMWINLNLRVHKLSMRTHARKRSFVTVTPTLAACSHTTQFLLECAGGVFPMGRHPLGQACFPHDIMGAVAPPPKRRIFKIQFFKI